MRPVTVLAPIEYPGQAWREKFPRGFIVIIGLAQMVFTWGILACETISMLNGIEHGFLFIGYGTSSVFIVTWIAVFGSGK